jgi:hypothetical protein
LSKRQTKVRAADFRLTIGQIAVSIFNNSEEAKRFNPEPGDEPGGGLITGCDCIRALNI